MQQLAGHLGRGGRLERPGTRLCRRCRGGLRRRQVAAALYPDPPLHGICLVPHCGRPVTPAGRPLIRSAPSGGQPTAARTVVCCNRNLRTETAMPGTTPGITLNPPTRWTTRLLRAGAAALAALLVACGGGSGDMGGSNNG